AVRATGAITARWPAGAIAAVGVDAAIGVVVVAGRDMLSARGLIVAASATAAHGDATAVAMVYTTAEAGVEMAAVKAMAAATEAPGAAMATVGKVVTAGTTATVVKAAMGRMAVSGRTTAMARMAVMDAAPSVCLAEAHIAMVAPKGACRTAADSDSATLLAVATVNKGDDRSTAATDNRAEVRRAGRHTITVRSRLGALSNMAVRSSSRGDDRVTVPAL